LHAGTGTDPAMKRAYARLVHRPAPPVAPNTVNVIGERPWRMVEHSRGRTGPSELAPPPNGSLPLIGSWVPRRRLRVHRSPV
jgi:hypothetical protein